MTSEETKKNRITRELMSRIRRRALTLSGQRYNELVAQLVEEIVDGRLNVAGIEQWHPRSTVSEA